MFEIRSYGNFLEGKLKTVKKTYNFFHCTMFENKLYSLDILYQIFKHKQKPREYVNLINVCLIFKQLSVAENQ